MPESPLSEYGDFEFDFSKLTEEDFKIIDAASTAKLDCEETPEIEDLSQPGDRRSTYSDAFSLRLSSLGPDELLELDSAVAGHFVNIEADHQSLESEDAGQVSFQSEIYGLNLNQLGVEELAALDNIVQGKISQFHGGPQLQIQVEDAQAPAQLPFDPPLQFDTRPAELAQAPMRAARALWNSTYRDWSKLSPMQQYRRSGVLSVSDIVAPAWCELQFDYGLRGKRSRPVKDRPETFKSASGKTIRVEKKVSVVNDVRTKHGQTVHKELEKEVKPEEIRIDVTTNETRWALRLINMMNCLQALKFGNELTREMPVFGIIHGEVVVGILDEVVRIENTPVVAKESPKRRSTKLHETSPRKRAKTSPQSTSQATLDTFAHTASKKDKGKSREMDPPKPGTDVENHQPQKAKSFRLVLKDNKTRGVMSLPSDDDAYSGKMQLMLYRRLLQELLATSPPYDFTPLWEKVSVDANANFPDKFIEQAQLINYDTGEASTCLNDLAAMWYELVRSSNITSIDPALELVYRLRSSNRPQKPFIHIPRGDPGDADFARAILASLADSVPVKLGAIGEHAVASGSCSGVGTSSANGIPDLDTDDVVLQWALQQSLQDVSKETGDEASALGPIDASIRQPENKDVIGTKTFLHNDQEMDGYVANVLRWWRGERTAQGVDLERSYRCNTCEYKADCEWREEKALEFRRRPSTAALEV